MRLPKTLLAISAIGLLLLAVIMPLSSQDETIITVAVPSWIRDAFDNDDFAPFLESHPGVKVVLQSAGDNAYYPSPSYDLEEHFSGAERYASSADVLYVSQYNLSPEAVAAGYFLNLAPLAEGDPELNPDDFYPAVWQSFLWDRGLWALPVTASVEVAIYDVAAFDEAGLPYPNETWTLGDVIRAGNLLTQRDASGSVTLPGFSGYNPGALFVSLYGQGFYDPTTLPNVPSFSHPELVSFWEKWSQFQQDITADGPYDFQAVPFAIEQPWRISQGNFSTEDREWAGALPPGGHAGLYVQGFAVSSGTENPELAYDLAKFMTSSPEVIYYLYGNVPARRSMVGITPEDPNFFYTPIDPETQALIDRAMESAIPISELRFVEYLYSVSTSGPEGSVDLEAAIQEMEAKAITAMETARQRGRPSVVVATPVPTPVIGQDQIVLKFGLNVFTSDPSAQDQWRRLVSDFVSANPRIGNIDLKTQFYQPEEFETLDCYYEPYNSITDPQSQTDHLLNLDPFLDADPTFERNDFLTGVIEQVQRDGRTWGYPISMQPEVMWFNTDRFAEAGVPEPIGGWTVEAFEDALIRLKDTSDPNETPFMPQTFGATHLMVLMAAYGGIPYDYRTDPPTVKLTDPETMAAVQEVLDLAKNGYMTYQEINLFGGGGFGSSGEEALTTDTFSVMSWRLQNRSNPDFPYPYKLTSYPRGSLYTPIAYSLGNAYIHSNTQDADACYRWISLIAQHPELFGGMPVRRSQINDPNTGMVFGDDVTALFQEFAAQLDAPNVLVMPGSFGGSSSTPGGWIEPTWMYQAFNDYVLNGVDFAAAMEQAQTNIMTYRECTGAIEIIDPVTLGDDPEMWRPYFRQFTDCAIAITPELREDLSFYYEDAS